MGVSLRAAPMPGPAASASRRGGRPHQSAGGAGATSELQPATGERPEWVRLPDHLSSFLYGLVSFSSNLHGNLWLVLGESSMLLLFGKRTAAAG